AADPAPAARDAAREAIARSTRAAGAAPAARDDSAAQADALAHRDDEDVDDEVSGAELLQRELGARVIDEIPRT
ncbi:hypothetical protein, partial [Nocardioides lentus]|uniref:hypothetical protein n=1 Tax=Nocardioides lentus TaxID=338077 RepID=UPI0031DDA4C7